MKAKTEDKKKTAQHVYDKLMQKISSLVNEAEAELKAENQK